MSDEIKRDEIKKVRPVFFISNSTGITVETLGRSLLYQFPDTAFESHSLRFIDTEEKACEAVKTINQQAEQKGVRPIILCTLVKKSLREIVSKANGVYLDVFNSFITPIEEEIGCHAKLGMEHSHHGINDDDYYSERIDAVNYSLRTDDGVHANEYEHADVILAGASRTGKTPTCLYLAMHYGLRAANYPIVDEEIDAYSLPPTLQKYKDKVYGLIVTPERLQSIRNKRRPDSNYASLSRCQYEIRQTEHLFLQEEVPYFDVSTMSIEEVASVIMSMLSQRPRRFLP